MKRRFHVIVKPIGPACNLDCTYCYYLCKRELAAQPATASISLDLLEEFIRQYIAGQDVDSVNFSWHGGEPTLLGVDFFQKVMHLQQKYAGEKRITNDIQTNGLLVDEAWCEFLKEHQFFVGLSIDGPRKLHDYFRKTLNGGSSFDQACRAAKLFQRYDIPFNVMSVINSTTARYPAEVYQFLTDELGARRLQWLPCVEPKTFRTTAPSQWGNDMMPVVGTSAAHPGNADSVVTDWSVDPDAWGEFLCQTFDLWLKKGLRTVLVNWFESLVGQWMRQPAQICVLGEVCGRCLVMEKDGSLYSCDHFVYPEYRLGNLNDKDLQLAEIVYSPRQRKFGCQKRDNLPEYCKQCSYRFACNGGCPKDRFLKTPDGQPGLNYLCSGTKRFMSHADPYLRQIVASVQRPILDGLS